MGIKIRKSFWNGFAHPRRMNEFITQGIESLSDQSPINKDFGLNYFGPVGRSDAIRNCGQLNPEGKLFL